MTVNVTQGSGGMTSWSVDGVNQVAAQWVYFGIGSGPQHPIDFLSATPTIAASPTNSLDVTYDNGSISARVKYTLTGGAPGSGISQFGETIAFNNHSGTNLTLHLFDYSEFDLGGASDNNQNLQWVNTPPLTATNRFWQTVGSLSLTNTFSSVPNPTRYEANVDGSTLASLLSGSEYTLNNQASASGDVTGALEWDVTLANGGGLTISKVVNLQVPEPSAAAVLGLGLLLLRYVGAKRQKF